MNAREREQQQQRRQSASEWASEEGSYTPTSIRYPEGMKRHKLEEGENRFDVIPFLSGHGNIKVPPGTEQWNRTFGRHSIPGPDGKSVGYNCLWETWKKPCPFCRYCSNPSLDQELKESLRSKKRLLLVTNMKPGQVDYPLTVLDANWYARKLGFGQQLQVAAQAARTDADYFFDLGRTDGKTLVVRVEAGKYKQVSRIDFARRHYDYPASILNSAPCLDDCFILQCPDHLKATPIQELSEDDWKEVYAFMESLLIGGVSAPKAPQQEETSRPRPEERTPEVIRQPSNGPSRRLEPELPARESTRTAPSAPHAKGTVARYKKGDEVVYEGDPCTVRFVEGTLLTLKGEDGKLHEDVPMAAVQPILTRDDDEGQKAPVTRTAPSKPKVVPDDDDMDLDDMDDD